MERTIWNKMGTSELSLGTSMPVFFLYHSLQCLFFILTLTPIFTYGKKGPGRVRRPVSGAKTKMVKGQHSFTLGSCWNVRFEFNLDILASSYSFLPKFDLIQTNQVIVKWNLKLQ